MSGYIGNIPVPQATQTRDVFTATSGQTSFATSGYTPGFLDVWLNGVKLVNGTDFTATNGSDVVLASGAATSDIVEVLSYSTYEVNNQAFTGDFSVDGTTFKVDSTNNRVGIGTATPDSPFVLSGTNVRQKITDGTNTLSMGQFDGLTNQIGSAGRDLYLLTSGANSVKFGTNNTERMNLDSSGRLTLPYQPLFRAGYPPPDGTITVNVNNKHPFSSAPLNVGNHYDTANYRFTAPVTGTYRFSACLWVNSNSAGDFAPKVNGSYIASGTGDSIIFAQQAQTMQTNLTGTFTIYLSANDQVELFARNFATSYYSGHSWWEGHLIG